MARRITRKQLKQSDEFVSTMDAAILWLSENWKPIVAGFAGICVAALLWWVVGLWNDSRSEDAALALDHAVVTYEGEDSIGQLEPTGDLDAAEAEFLQVIEHYGKTDQADMARIYLARIHFDRNQTDEARDLLVDLAERHRGDAIGRVASLDLIHLRIAAGQATEVAAELEARACLAMLRCMSSDSSIWRNRTRSSRVSTIKSWWTSSPNRRTSASLVSA